MRIQRWKAAVAAVTVLVISSCADSNPAPPTTTAVSLAQTLKTWDTADSTASAQNNIDGLESAEADAALMFSVSGANAARLTGHPQAQYQHLDPSFVSLSGTPSCVLASATVKLAGEELSLPDFSEFKVVGATWILTNHIFLARSVSASSTDLSAATAIPAQKALSTDRQRSLSTELFARTIGTKWTKPSTIGPSTLIDRQLLGGWQFYTQQMAKAKTVVTRTLNSTSWSACAAATAQGELIFLTMNLTDRLAPAAAGPKKVTIPSGTPDLQGLGKKNAVSGATIVIDRIESFVLQIPTAAGLPVQVMGMSDAPTAIHTT